MRSFKEFQAQFDLSMPALCTRILARHQDTIRIKKPFVAIPRLARIIDTTLTLANHQGFHSMSLRDLSHRSGLSMGALYAYFDSKDTLLMMILGQVVSAVDEVLGQAPPESTCDPVTHLGWLLQSHIFLTEEMHRWFLFAYMEAKAFSREGRALAVSSELATEKMIADVLADGVHSGCMEMKDVEMAAALIKPMLQDWYVKRAKHRKRGLTPESYAASVMEFVGRAIGIRRQT